MQPVTISDNLNLSVGAYLGGTVSQVRITWDTFTASDSTSVDAGVQIFAIPVSGLFARPFIPNEDATPATDYHFAYTVKLADYDAPLIYSEDLVIPSDQGQTVNITSCRVTGILEGPAWQGSITVPIGTGAPQPPPSGDITLLSGTQSINAPAVPDGVTITLQQVITIVGATAGKPVIVGVSPPLPDGFTVSGQVTSANTVTLSLTNNSGAEQAPGAASYTAAVVA